jgi:hypothetical protein
MRLKQEGAPSVSIYAKQRTLNSRPMRNTKVVTNKEPCCSAYMALPAPQGLYTACSTWAQPETSTANVTYGGGGGWGGGVGVW